MENNKQIKTISLALTLLLFVIGIALGWWALKAVGTNPKNSEQKTKSIEIDMEAYKKMSQSENFGTPVTKDEPGYGRVNPFAPYK